MPGVEPLPPEEIENYEAFAAGTIARMGFVVNSTKTMARRPEIREAFGRLFVSVFSDGEVDTSLKHMVAQVVSVAAGCRYCQAHAAGSAHRSGVPAEKIDALYEFESSPLFDEAERTALRFGRDAALQPNATTPAHFAALREHFTESQIVELTAAIATFGFLNRWNDTMATALEDEPLEFAGEHLAAHGWERGKHV
jgi:uncharacterized peroxidase-related enzyme